ncbi:uncharacterized protein [Rutidosis leptorrhynchoides]|uniref:uncharacterized protein n=1 Tax=Rutidosis leptorrhynchoides TaxID=125765 RepID=UPI003A99090E
MLRIDPLPTAEEAYAAVRKESAHQSIFGAKSDAPSHSGVATGLVASKSKESDGFGLVSKNQLRSDYSKSSSRDKDHLECTKCGMKRHTKEQCFKVIGYPEWWNNGHKKGKAAVAAATGGNQSANNSGATASGGFGLLAAEQPSSTEGEGMNDRGFFNPKSELLNNFSNVNCVSNKIKSDEWIIDCGATDTMTFDKNDICLKSKPNKDKIKTANGGVIQVKGGGMNEISPTLKLNNCLYVPALSHKLLSVSHVTKELNCTVLLHPTFCILQDLRTGEIIGRGTERDRLNYIEEVIQNGTVMIAHGTPNRQAWLWHRSLGHPSASYLSILFPSLFSSNKTLQCETCILSKSHQNSFKTSNTKTERPFALIHSDVWGPAKNDPNLTLVLKKCVFVGYGVNQKGYICYSPKKRHMFTTMNCDFLETEYFYTTQHTSQGETESNDTVSWLDIPSSEEVNNSTKSQYDPPVSTTSESPPDNTGNTEVSTKSSETDSTNHENQENVSEQETNTGQHESNGPEQQSESQQQSESEQTNQQPEPEQPYMLPPRANRGIPPKRYDPDREALRSRYPMANIAKGNLSKEAKTFTSAIYSEEIPTTVEQALKSKKWKEAMET